METIFHPSERRGSANHGWLIARHSFSFAGWYDPEKVNFGALRVINDDQVAPGTGFSTHPHDNMEIITIPLEGHLRHRDNMGHEGHIHPGELQIMSAGSGVTHSEFNASHEEWLKLFQIWIFPDTRNVEPRYQQISLNDLQKDQINLLVGPKNGPAEAWIHQNAFISMVEFSKDLVLEYSMNDKKNGVYILQVTGTSEIESNHLNERDAIGISETESITIKGTRDSKLLLFEVPMIF